jgi:hypothetical protein
MKMLTVKVSDALFAEISSAAELRKVPKSEIVRERLTRDVSDVQPEKASLWSRMEDLVIQEDSLPRDLSANKAHLRQCGKKRAR